MTHREAFVEWCKEQLGKPVLWGAKGPDAFDCSGFVTCGIRAVGGPDWTKTHNSDVLWAELDPVVGDPAPGDLAFWWDPAPDAPQKGNVEHVAVVDEGGLIITADGATHRILDLEAARSAHAMVRVRGDANYRKRLAGFRRFPLSEGPDGKPVLVCKVP